MNTEKKYTGHEGSGGDTRCLRERLAAMPSPEWRLTLLEHALFFHELPDDLAELHSKLKGELDPFPIPPVTEAVVWIEDMRAGGWRKAAAAEPYETGEIGIEVDGGGIVGGGWTASYLIEIGEEKIAGTLTTGDGDIYELPEARRGSPRVWREVFDYLGGLGDEYLVPPEAGIGVGIDDPRASSAICHALIRPESCHEDDRPDLASLSDDDLLAAFGE